MPITSAQARIQQQRQALGAILSAPLKNISLDVSNAWHSNLDEINNALYQGILLIPFCQSLYAMDLNGIQISNNISPQGIEEKAKSNDHSDQPFLIQVPVIDFVLSEAYISSINKKPSITAVHLIKKNDEPIGFIAATFKLKDLPLTSTLYEDTDDWRQLKGDPSIRGTLFLQQRTESVLDQHIYDVTAVINELMTERGAFHVDIHFSSNRAMVWQINNICKYNILALDDLMDTDICLAYDKIDYPQNARIPIDEIENIFNYFIDLRFADETIYLRIGSINIFNGMIGLTFSCDGSHYMYYKEFLNKKSAFWIGEANAGTSTIP